MGLLIHSLARRFEPAEVRTAGHGSRLGSHLYVHSTPDLLSFAPPVRSIPCLFVHFIPLALALG